VRAATDTAIAKAFMSTPCFVESEGVVPRPTAKPGLADGYHELSLRSSGRKANGRDEPSHRRTTRGMKSCYRSLSSFLSASRSLHPSVKSNDRWKRMPSAVDRRQAPVPSI
jgi:hypothetical protein